MLKIFTFKTIIIWSDTKNVTNISMGRPLPRLSEDDIPDDVDECGFNPYEGGYDYDC